MRIAMGIEYSGWKYSGFQRQYHAPAIQNELEKALSIIAAEPIEIKCAGRTDAGVSATGQVIHFDVNNERNDRAWLLGTNTKLPNDIAVTWVRHVPDDFHARFSARARRYRYILQNSDYRPGILRAGVSLYRGIAVTWVRHVPDDFHARFSARARRYRYILQNSDYRPGILRAGVSLYRGEYDVQAMEDAAQILLGENDFSSFKSAQDENPHARRNVHFVKVMRRGRYIIFDIQANAFLHHMVRNIVGSLLLVGNGEKDKQWLQDVFDARNRDLAGPTAQAEGLYLVKVTYEDHWNLPIHDEDMGPLWI